MMYNAWPPSASILPFCYPTMQSNDVNKGEGGNGVRISCMPKGQRNFEVVA